MDIVETYAMIRWIACAAGAALLRGAAPVCMRAGAKRSDPSFAAAIFATLLLLASCVPLWLTGQWAALFAVGNRSLLLIALSGLIAALAYLCLFTALTGAGVNRVLPLVNLSGVLMLALAYFFLGGRLGIWRLCCIVLILLGTVFMESRSEKSASLRWLLHAALALVCVTLVALIQKAHLDAYVSETVALPLRTAAACVLLWIFALARGKQKTARAMGVRGWLGVAAAAVCAGLALVLQTLGSSLGEWSWLAPIGCLGFASMLLFARIFLKEKLPGSALFGLLLVLLGEFAILMGW